MWVAKSPLRVQDCDMDHIQSDEELRRAIRALTDRALDARKRGDKDAAEEIERTIREYQDQMAQRR